MIDRPRHSPESMSTGDPRVEEIFFRAVEFALDRRSAYLDDACQDDSALRSDVESLLHANDERLDFLVDEGPP